MRVYRLETADQTGVFSAGVVREYADVSGDHPYGGPDPYDEGLYLDSGDHCGFKDQSQMQRWFPSIAEFPEPFIESDVALSIYEVPDNYVQVGEWQIVFNLDYADRIERVPVNELHRVFA